MSSPPLYRSPATGYRAAHGSVGYPLEIIARFIQKKGVPKGDDLAALAAELKLPIAVVRSTLSSYQDYIEPSNDAVKVCHGMSCHLGGAEDLYRDLHGQRASCLGHCYTATNYLDQEAIQTRSPENELSVLCLAPQPVITRNLLGNHAESLDTAIDHGCYEAYHYAIQQPPHKVIEDITAAGLCGRGGAAFPTGAKWHACASTKSDQRYVIANGDEGDPGSYIDRVLMEQDPHSIIEGLLLCGYAVGAHEGIVFIRSEYPRAATIMEQAISDAKKAGLLSHPKFSFNITVIRGAGSYVCGEETAMLNAIEGLRAEVRLRPPYPTQSGLFGQPTVVDNVETLVNVPYIVGNGVQTYTHTGTPNYSGTKALCFDSGFMRPGIIEVEFGTPFRDALNAAGGGRTELDAVFIGGPMGSIITKDHWDTPICYDAMHAQGLELGHGGVIALPKAADKRSLLRNWLNFMADESCGQCMPCRLGSRKAVDIMDSPAGFHSRADLDALLHTIIQSSLCAFGRDIPRAVIQYIDLFGDEIFNTSTSSS
ncbi:MAG: SLBB domain-containing protein [Verrucomicrobiae bacterium]|nr:SLBB domain-containing protein [Verrucomicrobiae bacterium]NNJ43760.1 NADP oxidoreductase [Akkermansiaceae bacterium]